MSWLSAHCKACNRYKHPLRACITCRRRRLIKVNNEWMRGRPKP